jgi:hypothetical protein
LAQKYHIHEQTVKAAVIKAGIRHRRTGGKNSLTPAAREAAIRAYRDGQPLKRLCAQYHTDRRTLKAVAVRSNIEQSRLAARDHWTAAVRAAAIQAYRVGEIL